MGRCSIKDIERERQTICSKLGHLKKEIKSLEERKKQSNAAGTNVKPAGLKRQDAYIKMEQDGSRIGDTPADKNTRECYWRKKTNRRGKRQRLTLKKRAILRQ